MFIEFLQSRNLIQDVRKLGKGKIEWDVSLFFLVWFFTIPPLFIVVVVNSGNTVNILDILLEIFLSFNIYVKANIKQIIKWNEKRIPLGLKWNL